MLNVYFTVDTEFGRRATHVSNYDDFTVDISRDIYGKTLGGDFGVKFKLDMLDSYGLKGVFFVEPIRFVVAGLEYLRDLVDLIQSRGHFIELHLHTEWLRWLHPSPLPGKCVTHMRHLSREEQVLLVKYGCSVLKDAGLVRPVVAFRAGNYGANNDTLRALAENGILIDSSYNYPYLQSACDIKYASQLLQPQHINGVLEVPISCFQDFPGHYRHVQLTATSFDEMRTALESAFRQGWSSFVIVSHSFELIKRNRHLSSGPQPDYWVINRFEKLLKYLGANKDKYQVDGFNALASLPDSGINNKLYKPLSGSLVNTACRVLKQIYRRIS